jgi:hypothetical protein
MASRLPAFCFVPGSCGILSSRVPMTCFRGFAIAVLLFVGNAPAAEWKEGSGYRSAALKPEPGRTGFTLLSEAITGIRFTNHLADRSVAENQIRLLGSGVALGDIDGDGRCDIYLCRLEGPNVLYRNLGDWKFENITDQAGVACAEQYSTGCALADVDGDGDLDLLVNSMGGGTRCFFNDGKGRFTENSSGLLRKFCARSMDWQTSMGTARWTCTSPITARRRFAAPGFRY